MAAGRYAERRALLHALLAPLLGTVLLLYVLLICSWLLCWVVGMLGTSVLTFSACKTGQVAAAAGC